LEYKSATMSKVCLRVLFAVLVATMAPLPARAGNVEEARAYVEKATAAYALNHYTVAGENFEKAFELKPDPALLYNAAQSYRLGGNKERALQLYESYLRVYGPKNKDKRPEIEGRIKQLREAIDHDRAVATSPPVTTEPMGGEPRAQKPEPAAPAQPAPVQPLPSSAAPAATSTSTSTSTPDVTHAPPPSDSSSSAAVTLERKAEPSSDEPVTKKTWFWVVVGAGVLAAGTVAVLLLAKGGEDPAKPTLGRAGGN
jgi:tetratricopeptide (TPR) repeat protein